MTPMSGNCRSNKARANARGYTLLEMVAVVAILALATALVAPPGYRMVRSWQDATQISDVIEQLERLPITVRTIGNPLTLTDAASQLPFALPEDWELIFDTPLHVQSNGACSNARARLLSERQEVELYILAPFCRVEREAP